MDALFFVVSPPRSGTSSICKMAEICGLKSSHVLRKPLYQAVGEFNFFADTPFYSTEFLMGLLNSGVKCKFIYINRPPIKIIESMNSVGILNYMRRKITGIKGFAMVNDFFAWNSLRNSGFENHKEHVELLAKTYNVPMLCYDFSMGWNPFCDFIGVEPPNIELPHLNKGKMGDSTCLK